jgi:CAAX prenyl protease-like protein
VGFCFIISRVPWFTTGEQRSPSTPIATSNPTVIFLLPFLMITAAAMVSGGGKAGFEWLYPLRFFAGAAALWTFRRSYKALDWGVTWVGPAIGAVVFVIWILVDRSSPASANGDFVAPLMAAPAAARYAWIIFRVLGAVITVPLAEELAFRGFLMRRLISPDFESVPFRHLSWFALLVSSLAFGLLHGNLWIAGSIAGVLFGLAVIRRGRIGDAVIAHATANALLAAYVLLYHDWRLWS